MKELRLLAEVHGIIDNWYFKTRNKWRCKWVWILVNIAIIGNHSKMRIKLFAVITKFQYCWLLKYVISSSLFWWKNKALDLFLFPHRFWYQFSYWGNVHQFSWRLLWTNTWNWLLKQGNNYEIPVAKILTRTAVVDFIDTLHVDLPERQVILNFNGSSRVSLELSLT